MATPRVPRVPMLRNDRRSTVTPERYCEMTTTSIRTRKRRERSEMSWETPPSPLRAVDEPCQQMRWFYRNKAQRHAGKSRNPS